MAATNTRMPPTPRRNSAGPSATPKVVPYSKFSGKIPNRLLQDRLLHFWSWLQVDYINSWRFILHVGSGVLTPLLECFEETTFLFFLSSLGRGDARSSDQQHENALDTILDAMVTSAIFCFKNSLWAIRSLISFRSAVSYW